MASAPVYASVAHNGMLQLANGDSTNLSAAIITGVAAGTRIKEIRVYSGPTTAPGTGVLTIHLLESGGSLDNVIEVLTLTNTANLQQGVFRYDNLILPGTTWSIKAAMRTAITSGGTVHISILGEDLT